MPRDTLRTVIDTVDLIRRQALFPGGHVGGTIDLELTDSGWGLPRIGRAGVLLDRGTCFVGKRQTQVVEYFRIEPSIGLADRSSCLTNNQSGWHYRYSYTAW